MGSFHQSLVEKNSCWSLRTSTPDNLNWQLDIRPISLLRGVPCIAFQLILPLQNNSLNSHISSLKVESEKKRSKKKKKLDLAHWQWVFHTLLVPFSKAGSQQNTALTLLCLTAEVHTGIAARFCCFLPPSHLQECLVHSFPRRLDPSPGWQWWDRRKKLKKILYISNI